MYANGVANVIVLSTQLTVYAGAYIDVPKPVVPLITNTATFAGLCTLYKLPTSKLYTVCVPLVGTNSIETTLYPTCWYIVSSQLVPGLVITVIVRLSVTTPGTNSSGP